MRAALERGIAFALREYLRHRIKEYGVVERVVIDAKKRMIHIELLPKGEERPISVTVEGFSVHREGEEYLLSLHRITASREWLERLLQNFVAGRPLPIPAPLGKLLLSLF